MCPRPGGEADKLGNHYEGAWTVRQLLDVLIGTADSVTVEDLGEIGRGVEFTLRRPKVVETHQVKRQHGSANSWTLGELRSAGVLEAAHHHVAAGREFHFVSTIQARDLDQLAGRARRSRDLKTFLEDMKPQQDIWGRFDYLSGVLGSAHTAWQTLRGTWAQCVDERELRNTNAALAGLLLGGAPPLVAAVTLADLILENLATPLDRSTIVEALPNGLSLSGLTGSPTLVSAVGSLLASWKAGVSRELVRPSIPRDETQRIANGLRAADRCLFAIGEGGIGKSVVIHDVVESLESHGWSVLAIRLDREEPFSTTSELGIRLGLDTSPVSALAAVSQDRPCLLVIDQLDAVSKASGRIPLVMDAVADLVREAEAFPNMRLILACRKFDFENDDRIRTLAKERSAGICEISNLSKGEVDGALEAMRIDPQLLNSEQVDLLRSPFHLKLLSSLSDQSDALTFASTTDLLHAYWERKRRDCRQRLGRGVRFSQVIGALAEEMSRRQRLTVPASVLDEQDLAQDADVLISEHVLDKDGRQVAFFHESFFDYAFARRWSLIRQTLTEFLLEGEQELFRRAQVRQILTHLRDEDPERFRTEMKTVLMHARVRYHVKDVVLALLRALPDPTAEEWHVVAELLGTSPPYAERLWRALRTSSWFVRLDTENVIEGWLNSNDRTQQHRALETMAGGAPAHPDRIAELLAPHANHEPVFAQWTVWLLRFAEVTDSRALFDLVLESLRQGQFDGLERDLFLGLRNLGEHRPRWAVDLLIAYLADRPDAFRLDELGRVVTLLSRDHGVIRMTTAAAERAPVVFAERIVPYLTQAASIAARDGGHDMISGWHLKDLDPEEPHHELGDAVLAGTLSALRQMVQEEPARARPLLEHLASYEHETARRLLHEGLAAGREKHAAWALELLLAKGDRLSAGDGWALRRVIAEISPHLHDAQFAELENAVISCQPSWEMRPRGRRSFLLLTAMDEDRLTSAGRRRLGELRRLFQADEPIEPEGLRGGFVESPIPETAASKMSDEQWLQAMERYTADEMDWASLRGGAPQLSGVLHEEVKTDPARFARLALRLTDEHHPAYLDAVMRGLGNSQVPIDPSLVFDAVRHVSKLPNQEAARWLGWALRSHLKADMPDDLIRILLNLALQGRDPETTEDHRIDDEYSDSVYRSPYEEGINTTRGATVETLGDAIVFDADGRRTALVAPALPRLVSDPSLAVRSCTAHLVAACLRHAERDAIEAFYELINCHDRLLATPHVKKLIVLLGNRDATTVTDVIRRMLRSPEPEVRKAGGALAAHAGLELARSELLDAAVGSNDAAVRSGAAEACAARLPHTANARAASTSLQKLVHDTDESVLNSAAFAASSLRGHCLQPFQDVLMSLIHSPTFEPATPQLLITLDRAPDRVDNLIVQVAERFVELHGDATGDISTGAAGDAKQVGDLLLRAYAQAADAEHRSVALDRIDELLAVGAYGMEELVRSSER